MVHHFKLRKLRYTFTIFKNGSSISTGYKTLVPLGTFYMKDNNKTHLITVIHHNVLHTNVNVM